MESGRKSVGVWKDVQMLDIGRWLDWGVEVCKLSWNDWWNMGYWQWSGSINGHMMCSMPLLIWHVEEYGPTHSVTCVTCQSSSCPLWLSCGTIESMLHAPVRLGPASDCGSSLSPPKFVKLAEPPKGTTTIFKFEFLYSDCEFVESDQGLKLIK